MVILSRSKIPLPRYDKKGHITVLKPVLWHLLFYFWHFGCYFELIEGTFVKMWAKKFICRLLNRLYGICCSIFSTLEVIFSRSKELLPRHERKRSLTGFETGFVAFAILLLVLDFIFSRSGVLLPRYRLKLSLASYEIGFTAFAVLYLAH